MIWLRRILTIPLILIFVIIFISVLLITQLNGTLGSSGFYNDQLRRADMYNWIYDDFMPVALDEAEENQGSDLPIPLHVIKDDLVSVIKETLPPDWLQSQTENAIKAIVPYVVGDKDSFSIHIQLRDRIDLLAPAVIEVASQQEIYDYLMYELIENVILTNVGQAVDLPFEVIISEGEIFSAITQVLPPEWVQERLAEIINELAAYLKGDTDRVDIVVDLADSKTAAIDRITSLADQKLRTAFNALPECNQADFEQALLNLTPGSLPDCRPAGLDYEGFKDALGIDVASSIDQMIGDSMPDSWVYTDAQLRQSLGIDNAEQLDEARDLIANGNTITEADLRDAISDDSDTDLQTFDDVRHGIHSFRAWIWVLWLIPVLLLVCIGLLGGRSWRTKLAGALAVLFITCLVIFIAVAVIQSKVIDQHAQSLIGDPADHQGVEMVMTEKGNEIAYNAISSFASGIQSKTLYIMIGSGIALLGIIVWTVLQSRRRRRVPDQYLSPTSSQSISSEPPPPTP
jgi:hypothetical protein